MTDRASEEDYDYPQFPPPPYTEHEQSDQRLKPPKVSTKRFLALPQKPTTQGRIEHRSCYSLREDERDHQG
jgi:hypothetical protein